MYSVKDEENFDEKFNEKTYKPDSLAKRLLIAQWFLTTLGVITILIYGFISLSKMAQAYQFMEIYGDVVSTRIIETRGSKGKRLYRPEITYSYRIDGEDHIGNTYDILNIEKGYKLSNKILEEYEIGKEIKVYVNLDNQDQSVLRKEVYPYYFLLTIFFVAIFFYWLTLLHMYKTGNYYAMYTTHGKSKIRLEFAFPTAKGTALMYSMYASFGLGLVALIIQYELRWSFYFLWASVLLITFLYSYQ